MLTSNGPSKRGITILAIASTALFTFSDAAAARSGDPGNHTRKGVAAAKAKDWDKAAAEFTKAIEAQPKDAKNYSNRGEVYKITGKLKEASVDFTKAIELDRNRCCCARRRSTRRSWTSMPH